MLTKITGGGGNIQNTKCGLEIFQNKNIRQCKNMKERT